MYNSVKEIRDFLSFVISENGGNPTLANKIHIEFNGRFTRLLGRARASEIFIEFSKQLWEVATDEQKENCIVHEFCHIYCYWNDNERWQRERFVENGHGSFWKETMVKFGYKPERYHSVDDSTLKRRQPRVRVYCACGISHQVTEYIVERMKVGEHRVCKKCKERLSLTPVGKIRDKNRVHVGTEIEFRAPNGYDGHYPVIKVTKINGKTFQGKEIERSHKPGTLWRVYKDTEFAIRIWERNTDGKNQLNTIWFNSDHNNEYQF